MLTYQLQRRVLMKKGQNEIVFPNDVKIEILFEKSSQFGNIAVKGRTVKQGSKASAIYDANTGRTWVSSDTPILPIDTTVEWKNLKLRLNGNKLMAIAKCNSQKDLTRLIETLYYMLPALLSIEFPEAPVVNRTGGVIGDVKFNWELAERTSRFDVTNEDLQEKRVLNSFLRINQLESQRLGAAIYYFYTAKRLAETGNSPFEFLAEIVLNLCKTLQALFGESREEVRHELLKCGYSKEEIETQFVPIMILRTQFDVGHVSLAILTRKQLDAFYRFLDNTELNFSELLKRIFDKTKNNEYSIKPDPDSHLDRERLKTINKLMETFERLWNAPSSA